MTSTTSPSEFSMKKRVVLVTGLSGAGKTASLKILEDMGYETVDGVPLGLLGALVRPVQPGLPFSEFGAPLAIGIDIRTRGFGAYPLLDEVDQLVTHADLDVSFVFLDCDDEVIERRYVETRHRHPLAIDRPVSDGIRLERSILLPLRERADLMIDTTSMALKDLKRVLQGSLAIDEQSCNPTIFVTSFSFRQGVPREADLVFDVRFLRNPHYDQDLRAGTGLDPLVGDYIRQDEDYDQFFDNLCRLLQPLLARYGAEGKSYLTIALGCTGGRHRSVFVAERLAEFLANLGAKVQVEHRELRDKAKA